MKNILSILKEVGIEVPESSKEQLNKLVSENYKTIAEHQKLADAKDKLEKQLETANATLEGFKDVDVDDLQKQIADAKKAMQDQEDEFNRKIADRDFDDAITRAIGSAKGKSAKAIKALLDIDTLKNSKNQDKDIADAIAAVKESDSYLFDTESTKKVQRITKQSSFSKGDGKNMTKDDIMAIKDPAERQQAMLDNASLFPQLADL